MCLFSAVKVIVKEVITWSLPTANHLSNIKATNIN